MALGRFGELEDPQGPGGLCADLRRRQGQQALEGPAPFRVTGSPWFCRSAGARWRRCSRSGSRCARASIKGQEAFAPIPERGAAMIGQEANHPSPKVARSGDLAGEAAKGARPGSRRRRAVRRDPRPGRPRPCRASWRMSRCSGRRPFRRFPGSRLGRWRADLSSLCPVPTTATCRERRRSCEPMIGQQANHPIPGRDAVRRPRRQRCCRVLGQISCSAFQNPRPPSPVASSGSTFRPFSSRSRSSSSRHQRPGGL